MANARFWHYHKDGPVQITLQPDQTLHHSYGGPDEEGWFSESVRFSYDGERVVMDTTIEGRDCDGYHAHYSTIACPLAKLRDGAHYDGVIYPAWAEIKASQRDEYAEAMGY